MNAHERYCKLLVDLKKEEVESNKATLRIYGDFFEVFEKMLENMPIEVRHEMQDAYIAMVDCLTDEGIRSRKVKQDLWKEYEKDMGEQ